MTHAVLLSVKPQYAKALMAGTKTAEVRRRFPDQPEGTRVFVYASSPVRALLGTVILNRVARIPSEDVERTHRGQIEIEKDDLDFYLEGVDTAAVLEVIEPEVWSASMPLDELRALLAVEPPQSYRYLSIEQVSVLDSYALSTS